MTQSTSRWQIWRWYQGQRGSESRAILITTGHLALWRNFGLYSSATSAATYLSHLEGNFIHALEHASRRAGFTKPPRIQAARDQTGT